MTYGYDDDWDSGGGNDDDDDVNFMTTPISMEICRSQTWQLKYFKN